MGLAAFNRARRLRAEANGEQGQKPEVSDVLQQLRERGKELGIPRASQMGEAKLLEAIAAKEVEQQRQEQEKQLQDLRDQAIALGIENVDEKDAETLAADIAATQGDGEV